MRRIPLLLVALLLSLFVSATPATAAAAPVCSADDPFPFCGFPGGTGWNRVNYPYFECERCRAVGAEGVLDGDWPDYRCGYLPVGLDFLYYLYVPA